MQEIKSKFHSFILITVSLLPSSDVGSLAYTQKKSFQEPGKSDDFYPFHFAAVPWDAVVNDYP